VHPRERTGDADRQQAQRCHKRQRRADCRKTPANAAATFER
jgi:hypothetical protein